MANTEPPGGPAPKRRKVALALQGGGSHGAFTWGVLDRMLEDQTIEIIGVTGTSAGAMNAVVLADGLLKGGPEQARRGLRAFWGAIGEMPGFASLLWPMSGESHAHLHLEQTPAYMAWDVLSRNLSPYDLNPFNFNPLRAPLTELIDFDRLRAEKDFHVMVCATNVLTSRRRVFRNEDISVDAVLASACLPQVFPAVEIDGEPYWDGGFSGNPAIVALVRRLPKCDMIIVRIDPIIRVTVPRTPREIHDRVTEISFNSTFWLELSALGVILKFVDEGLLDRERFGRIFFHAIEASSELEKIAASTKLDNSPAFLEFLFNLGRQTADAWFPLNGAAIGQRSTIDLQKLLPVGG
jgi:NTE family protein